MAGMATAEDNSSGSEPAHRRRPRYRGTHPRQFDERYKERNADAYPEMQQHIRAQGRTPAGAHVPVMVKEVIESLKPQPGEIVADVTLGHGGHAEAFLGAVGPTGRLVGLDVDGGELERTGARLAKLGGAISLHRMNYAGVGKVLAAEKIDGFDVIFADLGVSSMQLDDPERGFSYKHDGPLDMRMDSRLVRTAADILATITRDELAAALADLADEEDAGAVASAIARHRDKRPLTRTLDLAGAVLAAKGLTPDDWRRRRAKEPDTMHPAARTFQALRILVNDELGALKQLLRSAPWCLRAGGRTGIITFQSGEDRLVKQAFREGLRDGTYAAISDDCIRPTPAEIGANPRSRPAKFRWAERSA
jgi:16S rRNA (cytosine1402-N4)-methyltransferase